MRTEVACDVPLAADHQESPGQEIIVVSAVGNAFGARAAAAALACGTSDTSNPGLLIDVGAPAPRPTLFATSAARSVEDRLAIELPDNPSAARGQLCVVSVPAFHGSLDRASEVIGAVSGITTILHVPPIMLGRAVDGTFGLQPTAVLLRADLTQDRRLTALLVRPMLKRSLRVVVLKERLSWVVERRALFGAAPIAEGIPRRYIRRLLAAAS